MKTKLKDLDKNDEVFVVRFKDGEVLKDYVARTVIEADEDIIKIDDGREFRRKNGKIIEEGKELHILPTGCLIAQKMIT